jgi:transcriptional regulator with XRE-family HTH domain
MKTLSESLSGTISRNINDKLELLGWTAYRLGKETGCTQPRIYRVCSGENEPSVSLLRDIAEALECTMDELVAA